MDTSTFYVNGRFQPSSYPLDSRGRGMEKITTEGTESTEQNPKLEIGNSKADYHCTTEMPAKLD
jgi:hypothetical protein